MTQRDLNKELLEELKEELPVLPGFEYISEDPLGTLIYGNDGNDGRPACTQFIGLINGDINEQRTIDFHYGNPEEGIKGFTNEALIDILITRITRLNDNIPDWHNNLAIDGLSLAANSLNHRTVERKETGAKIDEATPRQGDVDMHPVVRRTLTNQYKLNFIIQMMAALGESFDQIYDHEVSDEFIEHHAQGAMHKIKTSPKEEESLAIAVAISQKLLGVVGESKLFNIILGTMVHTKKLEGANQQSKESAPTTEPLPSEEQPTDSTTQETSSN